jgi:hypothetical protein
MLWKFVLKRAIAYFLKSPFSWGVWGDLHLDYPKAIPPSPPSQGGGFHFPKCDRIWENRERWPKFSHTPIPSKNPTSLTHAVR